MTQKDVYVPLKDEEERNKSETNETTLAGYLNSAILIVRQAGSVLKKRFNEFHSGSTPMMYETKEDNDANVVTEVDKEMEKMIFSFLRSTYPRHLLIGEEDSCVNGFTLTDDPTWIIDPIDGTTNFLHGIPLFCISIGLTIGKQVVVGVVYNPITDELFSTGKGLGAFLNGSRLGKFKRPLSSLSKSCIGTEFGNDRHALLLEPKLKSMETLIQAPTRAIRCLGSAALNMCFVACNRLDAFFECGIYAWDIAAGIIIVQESGGWALGLKDVPETDLLLARHILCIRQGTSLDEMTTFLNELRKNTFISPYQ